MTGQEKSTWVGAAKKSTWVGVVMLAWAAGGCDHDGGEETAENTPALCADGADNDGDGLRDCDDPDCESVPVCAPAVELCDDGADNDGDGLRDCDDPDCGDDPACTTAVELCTDGADNDGDGLRDCDDPDCGDDPACTTAVELCDDGADNDGDGLLDCDDPDCEADPACLPGPCARKEDCAPDEGCIDGRCESLAGALFCAEPQRAMVILDQRLYAYIFGDLHTWVGAACARRGFGIRVMGVAGLDDMTTEEVRRLLGDAMEDFPQNEGVVLAGNVPLPTFFQSRLDVPQVKYWPRYYEDLDMNPLKTVPDGTVAEACGADGDGDGTPDNWPCIEPGDYTVPFTVPPHDFDGFELGPHEGLEQWVSFLPVGTGDAAWDTYEGWGEQLKPFLRKTLIFYADPAAFERNLYHVGNDLNMIAEAGTVWDEVGPLAIDYYAINTLGEGLCADNPDCYVRAPLEDYAGLEDFLAYALTLPWMGEGWQSSAVFLSHLNSDNHFPRRVVWWNVHSTATRSIISSDTAWIGIDEGKGGLIALLDGCMVGTYQRPGDTLPPDLWETPYPADNILVSLIYSRSAFIAAIGSVPLRTVFDRFEVILDSIYTDGYLGAANRDRSDAQDRAEDNPWGWRNHQEILIGDPFVDAM
jgi:hypothetical protein